MSQITRVRFWKDVGFQDGSIEVPSINDHLPAPDAEFTEAIKTSTSEFFSAFTIPKVFADYLSMSYVELLYEYNNSNAPMTFYGWIDDIALKSDTDGSPSIAVSWHIDHWRTYIANAHFGYGLVRNRPRASDDPPQLCTARYREPHGFQSMEFKGVGKESYWIIATFTMETADNKVTDVRTMVVPVNKGDPTTSCYMKLKPTSQAYKCPSLYQFVNGRWTEAFGIAPTTVSSVFISPIPPLAIFSGTGTATDPYVVLPSASSSEDYYTERGGQYSPAHGESFNVVAGMSSWSFTAKWTDHTVNKSASATYGGIAIAGYISQEYNQGFSKHVSSPLASTDLTYAPEISGDAYTYIFTLDDLIRNCIGDSAWSGLQDGDIFRINGNIRYGPDLAFSNSTEGSTTSQASVRIGVSGYSTATEGNNHEFIYSKGSNTFGNHKVLVRTEKVDWTLFTKQSTEWFDYGMNEVNDKCYIYTQNGHYYEYSQDLPDTFAWDDEAQTKVPIMTTDTVEWMFTDQTGVPVGTLPWGLKVKTYNIRNVISSTACYIEYRFDGIDSHVKGTSFIVPLPTVDIVSNSWSEYVYSGQRDYDIQQRKLASEQALTSGIISALTGGIDTAVMGALTNTTTTMNEKRSYAYGKETASESIEGTTTTRGIGGLRAGVVGIGAGVVGAGANYLIAQYYNGQLQKAEDILSAKQTDSVMMAGNGWDWMWNGREFGLVPMRGDTYSVNRFENDIRLNGVSVSEPTEDCDTYRTSEGPVRIAELIVTGDIPVQARAYIKGRMANGVRIRTINTEQPTV